MNFVATLSFASKSQIKRSSLIPNFRDTHVSFRRGRSLVTRFYASSSSSNPSPGKTPHTPDTYRKDETIGDPISPKTHVVGGQPEGEPRTERPFEGPTGTYSTSKESQPYELPTNKPEDEQSKSRYGGLNRDEDTTKDVDAAGGPQDAGKTGRK